MQKHHFDIWKNTIVALALVVLIAMCCAVALPSAVSVANADPTIEQLGKAAYVIDSQSGGVIYAREENKRLPIASMVKIMTCLLTFEAVQNGEVSLEDSVQITPEAAAMGGSQVFLQANDKHKLKDLLRTVIVASANDSCVAIANHICSSTSAFVDRMNQRAKELGMENTSFKNCTGLPAAESFSCAKDVATMFVELCKHPLYFDYAKVWMEDYKHPDGRVTQIANTNKLVRFYNGCDGGKTGFTGEAKFCLCATAKRDNMRLVAVVIGAPSAKERNAHVSKMFDYGFANYQNKLLLKKGEPLDFELNVRGGKQRSVQVALKDDLSLFSAKNKQENFEIVYDIPNTIKAPIAQGDEVGKVYLVQNGVRTKEGVVVATSAVEKMNIFDAIKRIADGWNTIVK